MSKFLMILCVCVVLAMLPAVNACARVASAQPTGRITGQVRDEQGRPLANVGIVIVATTAKGSYPEILPLSNERGEFNLADLPPGRYRLRATLDGYQAQTRSVEVRANRASRVLFALKK